jgi:hypothetical protein
MNIVSILFLALLAFVSAHQTTLCGNKDSFRALKRSTYKLPGNRYPKSATESLLLRVHCSTMQVQLYREIATQNGYINVDDIKKKARRFGKKQAKRRRKKRAKRLGNKKQEVKARRDDRKGTYEASTEESTEEPSTDQSQGDNDDPHHNDPHRNLCYQDGCDQANSDALYRGGRFRH